MVQHQDENKRQVQSDPNPPEFVERHPIRIGSPPTALITAQKPRFDVEIQGENAALEREFDRLGVRFTPAPGKYDMSPEDSYIVQGLTMAQAFELGRKFGQESVIHNDNGKLMMLYTNGPDIGKYNPGKKEYEWFKEEPEDYYTRIPEGGYLRLRFDYDQLHDSGLGPSVEKSEYTLDDLKKAIEVKLQGALRKYEDSNLISNVTQDQSNCNQGSCPVSKQYTIPEVRQEVAKCIQDRIDAYKHEMYELRKKELAKKELAKAEGDSVEKCGHISGGASVKKCGELSKTRTIPRLKKQSMEKEATQEVQDAAAATKQNTQQATQTIDRALAGRKRPSWTPPKVGKSEDFIDLHHPNDPDKRLKNQGAEGILPGDVKPKVRPEGEGSGGQIKQSKIPGKKPKDSQAKGGGMSADALIDKAKSGGSPTGKPWEEKGKIQDGKQETINPEGSGGQQSDGEEVGSYTAESKDAKGGGETPETVKARSKPKGVGSDPAKGGSKLDEGTQTEVDEDAIGGKETKGEEIGSYTEPPKKGDGSMATPEATRDSGQRRADPLPHPEKGGGKLPAAKSKVINPEGSGGQGRAVRKAEADALYSRLVKSGKFQAPQQTFPRLRKSDEELEKFAGNLELALRGVDPDTFGTQKPNKWSEQQPEARQVAEAVYGQIPEGADRETAIQTIEQILGTTLPYPFKSPDPHRTSISEVIYDVLTDQNFDPVSWTTPPLGGWKKKAIQDYLKTRGPLKQTQRSRLGKSALQHSLLRLRKADGVPQAKPPGGNPTPASPPTSSPSTPKVGAAPAAPKAPSAPTPPGPLGKEEMTKGAIPGTKTGDALTGAHDAAAMAGPPKAAPEPAAERKDPSDFSDYMPKGKFSSGGTGLMGIRSKVLGSKGIKS